MPAGDARQLPTLRCRRPAPAPVWCLLQRHLLATMGEAAQWFFDRYTRPDGTLVWRTEWPGMDGSDDGYESWHAFPLLYLLGGDARLLETARRGWDAVTWQFTEYGQIHREFDAYYDWMHHGESSLLLYYLALADPSRPQDRQRAARFAAMYTGNDPEAPNYDPARRQMRSPITGSRGPRLTMTAEDWCTHRAVLDAYPPPFEDIPGVSGPTCPWTDDAVFAQVLARMNARMARGDVPLNLTAAGLVAHAFLFTGERSHRDWVADYVAAWAERARANGGILPDNVGPTGRIGECMDGKWWGGYYGWRWPHGASVLLDAVAVGCMSAALLAGDAAALDLVRSQVDALWALGRAEDGIWKTPTKRLDAGWTQFRPADGRLPVLIWSLSQAAEDAARVARVPGQDGWDRVADHTGKGDQAHTLPWYRYITGHLPAYPEEILRLDLRHVALRLDAIRRDGGDPASWDVHHWQDHSPVLCEGLVQTMLGAPMPIYHGGLLHSPVRYFDGDAGRPGLPPGVGALVEGVGPGGVRLRLVNADPLRAKRVVVQGGAFGEHLLTRVAEAGSGEAGVEAGGPWAAVDLAPGAGADLEVGMRRFAGRPSYGGPWGGPAPAEAMLRGRAVPAGAHAGP